MRQRKQSILALLVAVCILILLWPLEGSIEAELTAMRPERAEVSLESDLPGIYRFLQLAGLNALLADILWMKADDLWHSSSWFEMAPVMEAIVRIDTNFVMVWRVLAWHYGWNLHAADQTQVGRAFWLDKAADAYARGIRRNPDSYELYWDMCWFYLDRMRNLEKAAQHLETGVEKFPDQIFTIERSLQHVYERTWRVDDAVAVIEDIIEKRPEDNLARRDLEWWQRIGKDENWRWVLEVREQINREKRDLPLFRNPFEGTLVESPPWRDWDAPYFMDPNWKPDLSRFEYVSVEAALRFRPDVAEDYFEIYPERRPREPVKGDGPSLPPMLGMPGMGPPPTAAPHEGHAH